ncbi:PQQ-binding-like beta-propeller repeat protein [Streptomyces aureus]|uniref:serine/threonine-protein kinase n=1 Tax=Streptomyces aureus TaxID=193461 RepID=UPI0031E0FC6E
MHPLHPGDPARIGGYTLLGRLGSGGMGTVFLARTAGGRVVALKTVREELAREPEFRIRFRLEAEAARAIGARHGAAVVDADTQGTVPWLATKYLLGPALDEAVQRYGPLPEPVVRALGARLADTLAEIHGAGLVHRDLKPSNILITASAPRVIDFGIARALGARRVTRTGQTVGTPAYMSPEQAVGREHEPPGDVFALGGVLVFAASGHGPFPGEQTADVLHRVRYGDPDLTGVPDALVPVLRACLSKEPDGRPDPGQLRDQLGSEATEFAQVLPGPLLADIGRHTTGMWELRPTRSPGPPPELPPRVAGPTRRRLLLAGAGGLTTLGAAGVSVWAARRTDAAPDSPRTRAPGTAPDPVWTYKAGAEATVQAVRDGVVVVSVGDDKDARTALGLDARTGKVVWRQKRELSFPATGQGDVVQGEIPYMDRNGPLYALNASKGGLTRFPGELRAPKLSRPTPVTTGGGILCLQGGVEHGGLLVTALAGYRIRDGKRLWLHRTAHSEETASGTVVGDLVLYSTSTAVVALRRTDGRERWRMTSDEKALLVGPLRSGAFADGRVISSGSELRCLDTATGKVLWRFGRDRVPYPDGQPFYGSPVVSGDTLYVVGIGKGYFDPGEASTDLLALRVSDGRLLWSYNTHSTVKLGPQPYLHNGVLYVDTGTIGQPLFAVDLRTHRPPWTLRSGAEDDGRLPQNLSDGRTALVSEGRRLFVSYGTEVLALPVR